jgi:hypothetical protein
MNRSTDELHFTMLKKTLFEFCVDSIIEEMERGWGQKSSKVSDVVNPEVSSNPFEHLRE